MKTTKSNNCSEFVDISSYTSNYYTTPCNGYAFISCNDTTGRIIEIHSANSTNTNYAWCKVANDQAQIVYCPKGVRLKTGGSTTGAARFYKFNSYS